MAVPGDIPSEADATAMSSGRRHPFRERIEIPGRKSHDPGANLTAAGTVDPTRPRTVDPPLGVGDIEKRMKVSRFLILFDHNRRAADTGNRAENLVVRQPFHDAIAEMASVTAFDNAALCGWYRSIRDSVIEQTAIMDGFAGGRYQCRLRSMWLLGRRSPRLEIAWS